MDPPFFHPNPHESLNPPIYKAEFDRDFHNQCVFQS